MPANRFTITSVNPWRMLLFGSLGVLIPLAVYIALLEFAGNDFKSGNESLFNFSMIAVLILSALGGYLGFKFSAGKLELIIDDNGFSETISPGLSFLPVRKSVYHWYDVKSHTLTEDSKGKILQINLKNNKRITIGIAYVLNESMDFDAFYAAFILHVNNFNSQPSNSQSSEVPIQASPGFYQSKPGKLLAYLLILLMIGLFLLLFISDKKLSYWEWFRLVFFETLAGFYVIRSLFRKV